MADFGSIVPDSGVFRSRSDEWLVAIQPLHQQVGSIQAHAIIGDFGVSLRVYDSTPCETRSSLRLS